VPITERQDWPKDSSTGAMHGWDEIRRWRKVMRTELLAKRLAITGRDRTSWNEAITARLLHILPNVSQLQIGVYWPFKGEYDLRPLAQRLHAQGARLALPVVVAKGAPLLFRHWRPGARMASGIWDIPIPVDGEEVSPELLLIPLVGYDRLGFRLGYGGGYYDRTIAAMPIKPQTIGIGFAFSELPTIFPQSHDIPMDLILTERQVHLYGDRP
jgi:5-formyltetrahydrofolate cyclo-ligase